MRLSGDDLMRATGGDWRSEVPDAVSGISTDTRKFPEGHAFLALRGPHFDGHRFAAQVSSQASALIGDRQGAMLWDDLDTPQLRVEDTLVALGDIANAWRRRLVRTSVIAITGSYGKTTVRSMLAHLFSSLGIRTAATHANLNNLVGVPTTLLGIGEEAEVALIECGISEKGEMSRLSRIVQPDVVVITGISAAHSEGLGGINGVASEKALLASQLQPGGWCALGSGVAARLGNNISARRLDMDGSDDAVVQWQLDGSTLTLFTDSDKASLSLAMPAAHWAADMALAATVVYGYFRAQPDRSRPSLADIADALSQWRAVDGRMQMQRSLGGACVIDDSYNANPASMQAALDTLKRMDGRKIAIIGDMAELEDAPSAHTALDLNGIDMPVLVGRWMRELAQIKPDALWFGSTDEAVAWVRSNRSLFGETSCVLVKASRSMQLDRVVRALTGREDQHAL